MRPQPERDDHRLLMSPGRQEMRGSELVRIESIKSP